MIPALETAAATGSRRDTSDSPQAQFPRAADAAGFACIASARPTASPAAAQTSSRGPPRPAPRILLVEDEGMILQLSAMTLIRAGYQVRAMDCCETAWEALQSGGYDLLVTDNHMPGMSGLDLVRRLHSAQIALPVIIASGGMDAEELARNQSLQPAIALPKPFTVGQLLATVARALLRRAAPDLGDTQASLPEPRDFASHWGINE